MSYCIAVLKPVNNNIACHIIKRTNWNEVIDLCHIISCLDSDHNETSFTKKEAQHMCSIMDCFLNDMCYTKNGITYMDDGDALIYSAKEGRDMLPFLKKCCGFTVHIF